MPARQLLGGFIPSNGVGTGFSRHALEMIARKYSNRIFEPACMTEDYENGFRIKRLGLPQKFIPVNFRFGRPIATREYFPRKFPLAIKQRTRWIMGITLQSWEYHSACETFAHFYWFWRDRKALIANLIAPVVNALFLLGVGTFVSARAGHHPWLLAVELSRYYPIYAAGLGLQAVQTTVRATCSAKIYGWRFALFVPARVFVANFINCIATVRAICIYASARIHRRPLVWTKTEHAFPNRTALIAQHKRLGEILTGSPWVSAEQRITQEQLAVACASQPPGRRLGEHLVRQNLITEEDLYAALSLQHDLPLGKPDRNSVSIPVTRTLPAAVSRKWRVLPFRISAGELYVAGAELPDDEMRSDIRQFSSLEIRFQLVTPSDFEELAAQYL